MQIEVNKTELQNALLTLTPIASTKTPLAILSHLLFYVSDSVYITATNLELGARVKISATIKETGSFTLLANKLSEIIANMPNETISFTQKESIVTIKSGSASFKLQTLDTSDFPVFADLEQNESKEFETTKLLEILNNTLYAASTDDSRFNLNSLYFTEYNNIPSVVATDGHRLALQYTTSLPFPKGTLVPVQGCELIKKFLSRISSSQITLNSDSNNIIVSTDDTMIIIRLIVGEFSDITRVIPTTDPESVVLVNTEKLKASTKLVSLVTDQTHKGLTLVVKEELELSAVTPLGMANDIVTMKKTGIDFELQLNAKYLLDSISTIKSDLCKIALMGEGKPIIFSEALENDNKNTFFNLIMPLRK